MSPAPARILGGLMGLPRVSERHASLTDARGLHLVNARSALALLVRTLRPPRVWLPSYLCRAVFDAVAAGGSEARFFEVDGSLRSRPEALAEVGPRDLVVVIAYFGFPLESALVRAARERGARVVADASQAFFTRPEAHGTDFVITSPRKFVGVPEGGVLHASDPALLPAPKLDRPPADWWLGSLDAAARRAEFDRGAEDRSWFQLFQKAEEEQPIGDHAMSDLSRALLERCFDGPAIARRRVENFRLLAERLRSVAVLHEVPESCVPLGFPIRTPDRDRLRRHLFAREIYPAVHWPLEGLVPASFEASHRLSAEILTLPCDQRCDREDMERLARAVSDGLASP